MLDFFRQLFSSNSIRTTSFFTLYQNIVRWRNAKVYPYPYNLPEAISMPESFWKDVIKIYRLTDADGMERAMSVWYADGDLVTTPPTRGDEKSVTTRDSISVKYSPHPTRNGYYRKEVFVNQKLTKRIDVFHEKAPKKVGISYLFNMHTHPKYSMDDGTTLYSFFSAQDIRSLISSQAIMTGLVTDKLWLLMRTSETPNSVLFNDGEILTVDMLKNDMKLGVYCADFNSKVIKQ